MDAVMLRCYRYATDKIENGLGVVWLEDDKLTWITLDELGNHPNPAFKGIVKAVREDDENPLSEQHFYVLHKDKLNVHVSKINKVGLKAKGENIPSVE